MLVHLLVLNYNGRRLLAECLPSVVDAARTSRHRSAVTVIDNDSEDDSVAWLGQHFPQVELIRRPNRGLVSFNDVVSLLPGRVAILLNNDVKLDRRAIDPLVEPLISQTDGPGGRCFMTAPRCVRFDGTTYEGLKAAVRWRHGLVEATAFYPGHERVIDVPDLTAAAGSVLAVDRRIFTELGGFDPLYLPGRLEDLDFAFRAYMAGHHARYVPEALAYHLGMGTFGEVYGEDGCQLLALRNTLLFQWKNLRHPLSIARQVAGVPARLVLDVLRAPWVPKPRRFVFARALAGALARVGMLNAHGSVPRAATRGLGTRGDGYSIRREREFFDRFHPRRMAGGEEEIGRGGDREIGKRERVRPESSVSPSPLLPLSPSPLLPTSSGRPTITAAIITLDEGTKLPGLLERLDWVDQIVVVDAGSQDDTVAIARSFGCVVHSRPFDTFARQRNYALSVSGGDWVLSVDADERPTPQLAAEIRRRIGRCRQHGFRVPIRSTIFGRRLRRSGTQHDCPVRLVRRESARWSGDVHEVLTVGGPVGGLDHWLVHETLPDLNAFLAKMHRYTELGAKAAVAAGRAPRRLDRWIAPPREVFRRLIWKQGFLDGPEGWAFCTLSGLTEWVLADRHATLWRAAGQETGRSQ